MWLKTPRRLVTLLVVLTLVGPACTPGDGGSGDAPLGEGAASAQESVTALLEALDAGNFSAAAPLAMPDQAALASLAEGATFGEVAEAIRSSDPSVSANFWGGFAQGTGSFLTGTVSADESEIVTRDGLEYHIVRVTPESGSEREMMSREQDGYRVDIFASFAPGLAGRMVGPVERLLAAQTDDSALVLNELQAVVPSLLVAAERPGQSSDVVQSVLRLVELITRVN